LNEYEQLNFSKLFKDNLCNDDDRLTGDDDMLNDLSLSRLEVNDKIKDQEEIMDFEEIPDELTENKEPERMSYQVWKQK